MNLFIKKNGISLIVLVITIIVIIILASAVILSLSNNNSIVAANEAQFKQNIDDYKSELSLYELSMYSEDKGGVNITTINATSSTDPSIKKIISSMKDDDTSRFAIEKGELVYLNNLSSDEKIWAQELGLKPSQDSEPYEQGNSAVNEGAAGTSIANNSGPKSIVGV